MTRLRLAGLAALVLASCVLDPVSLEGKRCDEQHACLSGWLCRAGTCVACADGDGDGMLPLACRGNDCDDSDPKVGPGNPEVCDNGKDDDCDGKKDAEDPDCQCVENEEKPCGTCPGATHVCHGGVFGACTPPVEVCDGSDNDCSGAPDDVPGFACVRGASEACTTSCGTTGQRTCDSGCQWGPCVVQEICDGVDNDCDGARDNGFACISGDSLPCRTSCGSTGSATCSATCTAGACTAPAETCNGADDDCDGKPDNGFACVRGVADANAPTCDTSCHSTGHLACDDTCSGYHGACVPPAEVCNGLDEDCDNIPDNGLVQLVSPLSGSGTAGMVAIASGADGLVAYATTTAGAGNSASVILASGKGAALETPAGLSHLTVTASASGHPRDVELAVGNTGIAALWIDDQPTPQVHMAIAARDASALVRPDFVLGAATAGTTARVAFVPGSPGSYLVSFIQGGQGRWLSVTEDGSAGTIRPLAQSLAATLKFVSVGATSDGKAALGWALDAGNGAMRPQVAFVSPASGTVDPPLAFDWSGSGVLRDDGIELAGSDELLAAFAVVTSGGGGDVRTVLAATVRPATVAHAMEMSPAAAPVLGLVRLAAQPGGALVTWTELQGSGDITLAAAAMFGSGPVRTRRIDETGNGYLSMSPAGAQAAFDGATYRTVWTDHDTGWMRRLCP